MNRQDKELRTLTRMLSSGRVSRREFLSQAGALGVSAVAASSMWGKAAKAAPAKGGHFRVGVIGGAISDSLDPTTFFDQYMFQIGYTIRNNLTEIAPDNATRGELAESWEPSADASTWVFNLRKGVEFTNGKSLDAEDVIASINLHRGEDSKSGAKGLVAPVTSVKADGKHKVVFELESGNADFPALLSDYHLNIVPAKDGVADWQSGAGTGNYMLESFEPGVRTILKRNPNAWKENAGYFDSAESIHIADEVARQSALITNEVDVIMRVGLKTVDQLANVDGIRIEEVTGTFHYIFGMDTRSAPFNDNNVRLAFKYALNREVLLARVLRGHGTLGNDNPVSPANRYFAELPPREYDPDRAKSLLRKAGLSSLEVDLNTSDGLYPGAVDAASLYAADAKKAGIKINIKRQPVDGYWSEVWMRHPFVASYHNGRPTEDWLFSVTYAAGAPWNETFWDNERFNELLLRARGELDETKRREMYYEMQSLVQDDGGSVIPMYGNHVAGLRDKVQHPEQISTVWPLDGLKCIERWWFA